MFLVICFLMTNYGSCFMLTQYVEENLGVMSIGFLLSSPDDAVIWRGPKKNGKVEAGIPCSAGIPNNTW